MAGLGTSGSLVAGAALLFVLGSAIVAFRGWPQIATGPATTAVPAAARPAAPSQTARRLAAVLRRRAVIAAVPVAGAGVRRPGAVRGHRGVPTRPGSSGSSPRGGNAPAPVTGSASATSVSNPNPGSGVCVGSSCTNPQSLVTHLTSTVNQQVTTIGQQVTSTGLAVGPQVSSASNAVAGAVSGVNPQAASAVQSAGSAVGNTVSGTATTAGNVVSQVGSALGAGH